MVLKVRFSSQALADLRDMHNYIKPRGGQHIADAYVSNIYQYCLSLSLFPERGIRRDDIWQGLRLVGFKRKATIAIEIKGNELRIVRIFGRGQNIDDELL